MILLTGRKRVTTTCRIEDFQQEVVQIIVTDDVITINPNPTPCEGGNHTNIVESDIKYEIALNDGSIVFIDMYCTGCGMHFPIIP